MRCSDSSRTRREAIDPPKRPAHRPTSDNPATLLITIKATPEQKAKFLELGGSRWMKRLINEAIQQDEAKPPA